VGLVEPAADGEVEDQEERVTSVERPVDCLYPSGLVDSLKQHVVDIPSNLLRLPFHGEDMELAVEVTLGQLVFVRGDQVAARIRPPVQCPGSPAR